MYIGNSIKRDDVPLVKDVIRIEIFQATFVEQVGLDIKLTKFFSFDLKGYFP